jgi:hypothetical protein
MIQLAGDNVYFILDYDPDQVAGDGVYFILDYDPGSWTGCILNFGL